MSHVNVLIKIKDILFMLSIWAQALLTVTLALNNNKGGD